MEKKVLNEGAEKKQYQKPQMNVVKLGTMHMMAQSPGGGGGLPGGGGGGY